MPRAFGALLLQNRPVAEVARWATAFDRAGADAVYVADHLANPYDLADEWHDGWVVLAAVSAATARCRIGPLVTNFVLHSPVALARLALTLQTMSGGRLVLAVGAGGAPFDRSASAVPDGFPQLAERLDQGLTTLRALLAGHEVDVAPVTVIGGRTTPASWGLGPAARAVPRPELMVGGQGGSVIRAAVRHADAWNTFGGRPRDGESGLELMARRMRELDDACAEAGRAPATVRRTALIDALPTLAPTSDDELADVVGRLWEIGYDEVAAYAWFSRDLGPRTPEALLGFVEHRLPGLR
jgi:alkanesulfonate monooxygenase SsuD/methylene tetrahydromethanopterin reductase-like flavin-dependent oxidoreductase (luciferase family)